MGLRNSRQRVTIMGAPFTLSSSSFKSNMRQLTKCFNAYKENDTWNKFLTCCVLMRRHWNAHLHWVYCQVQCINCMMEVQYTVFSSNHQGKWWCSMLNCECGVCFFSPECPIYLIFTAIYHNCIDHSRQGVFLLTSFVPKCPPKLEKQVCRDMQVLL